MSTSPFFYDSSRVFVKTTDYDDVAIVGDTEIGNDVLISSDVCILAGVKIQTGAIIGAGAVVVDDVPPYAIAVGVPARVVGFRFRPEIIERLLNSAWWDLPLKEIYTQYKSFGVRDNV